MQAPPPFDLLPDELVHRIMLRCSPSALTRCEVVSHRWRECVLASGSSVWLLKTEEMWRRTGWIHNVSSARPLSQRLSSVSAASMRQALSRYDCSGLSEKSEWIRLLRSHLLWGLGACTKAPTGWVVPRWAIRMDDCKAAYLFARREITREAPLETELTRQKWDLLYNHHPVESFEIEFFENREMVATSHPGARFRWQIQDGGLQIETFPLHMFSRTSHGLWRIANENVVMTQRAPPPGDAPVM